MNVIYIILFLIVLKQSSASNSTVNITTEKLSTNEFENDEEIEVCADGTNGTTTKPKLNSTVAPILVPPNHSITVSVNANQTQVLVTEIKSIETPVTTQKSVFNYTEQSLISKISNLSSDKPTYDQTLSDSKLQSNPNLDVYINVNNTNNKTSDSPSASNKSDSAIQTQSSINETLISFNTSIPGLSSNFTQEYQTNQSNAANISITVSPLEWQNLTSYATSESSLETLSSKPFEEPIVPQRIASQMVVESVEINNKTQNQSNVEIVATNISLVLQNVTSDQSDGLTFTKTPLPSVSSIVVNDENPLNFTATTVSSVYQTVSLSETLSTIVNINSTITGPVDSPNVTLFESNQSAVTSAVVVSTERYVANDEKFNQSVVSTLALNPLLESNTSAAISPNATSLASIEPEVSTKSVPIVIANDTQQIQNISQLNTSQPALQPLAFPDVAQNTTSTVSVEPEVTPKLVPIVIANDTQQIQNTSQPALQSLTIPDVPQNTTSTVSVEPEVTPKLVPIVIANDTQQIHTTFQLTNAAPEVRKSVLQYITQVWNEWNSSSKNVEFLQFVQNKLELKN